MRLKDHMTYEEKVEFFFENDERKGQLSDDCFCRVIGGGGKTAYTLTVDTRPNVTEITAHTYDEEEGTPLENVLNEYGVYEWDDLPVMFTGCAFCPSRYECDIVREEVEDYWQTFID